VLREDDGSQLKSWIDEGRQLSPGQPAETGWVAENGACPDVRGPALPVAVATGLAQRREGLGSSKRHNFCRSQDIQLPAQAADITQGSSYET